MEYKEQQPPMTVDKQIANLRSLGLIIENEELATAMLNDVSYFRLIKAFSLGLKPKNGKYNEGVTFDQIVDLYKFNCNFIQLLFPMIERIEINLRCRLANYFSSKYGVLGYEDPDNFEDPDFHQDFLKDIEEEIRRNSKSPFVKNFRTNYKEGKIPMYALVELFSFGTLSKFFKNMKQESCRRHLQRGLLIAEYVAEFFQSGQISFSELDIDLWEYIDHEIRQITITETEVDTLLRVLRKVQNPAHDMYTRWPTLMERNRWIKHIQEVESIIHRIK